MSDTSSIVLTGEILPGHALNDVVSALAVTLRTTEEKALSMLVGSETTIKRRVPNREVGRYLLALQKAGAQVRIEASAGDAPAKAAPVRPVKPSTGFDAFPTLMDVPLPKLAEAPAEADEAPSEPPPPPMPRPSSIPAASPMAIPTAPNQPRTLTALSLVEDAPAGAAGPVLEAGRMICPVCQTEQPKSRYCDGCGFDLSQVPEEALKGKPRKAPEPEVDPYAPGASMAALSSYIPPEELPPIYSLSTQGRLGRLRYLAYPWAYFPVMFGGAVIAGLIGALARAPLLIALVAGVLGLMFGWMNLRLMVLRLHDIGIGARYVVLGLLLTLLCAIKFPALALLFAAEMVILSLVLACWPGSAEANEYGAPCPPNNGWVIFGAVAWLLMGALSGLGAKSSSQMLQERLMQRAPGIHSMQQN